jgi:hypothetical protein
MALKFAELISATRQYADAERRAQTTESISATELKQLMSQSAAMGGNINENMLKLYGELRKQTTILSISKQDPRAVSASKQGSLQTSSEQTDQLKQIAEQIEITKAESNTVSKEVLKVQQEHINQLKRIAQNTETTTQQTSSEESVIKTLEVQKQIFNSVNDTSGKGLNSNIVQLNAQFKEMPKTFLKLIDISSEQASSLRDFATKSKDTLGPLESMMASFGKIKTEPLMEGFKVFNPFTTLIINNI